MVLFGTAGAVSRFVGRKERPKAYECKVVLRDVLWAQRDFMGARGRFAASLEELRFKLPEKRVYTYSLEVTDGGFVASCEHDGDRWQISPAKGEPEHVSSGR
ncbi:MAG: hypothetical protein JNK82_08600 [Myxococcaceae bacterium]|nr:hypothetical protein [Myxococcaceae bacterium]